MQQSTMNLAGIIVAYIASLAFSSHLFAQDIVRLDPKALSGLGLEGGTTDVEGQVRYGKMLYDGEKFNVSVAAGNAAGNREVMEIESFPFQEFCYILNGTATLIERDGAAHTFHTGDFFVIPKGFSGTFITQGNHLYQVLLVIADERSDSFADTTSPMLIDRANISGLGLESSTLPWAPELQANRKLLFDGSELTISVVEGEAHSAELSDLAEEFVYVVSGSATLTGVGGEPQTFYKGDFFVVPEGWSGTWAVDGNMFYRELIAVAAE